jgi:glycosyltransferase involved in cell wall biosynthesis
MTIVQANKFYFLRGGAERYLFDLSAWLQSEGHTVIPFAMQHPENLPTPFAGYFPSFVQTERPRLGWEAVRTFGRMLYSLEARRNMASLLVETRPDVCHVHNIYSQISPSILHTLRDRQVPVLMTVHDYHLVSPQYSLWAEGCGPDWSRVGLVRGTLSRFHKHSYVASFAQVAAYKFHRWLRIYERFVDRFQTPSEFMRRRMIAGGFPAEKIETNHHGIDPSSIRPRSDHDGYFLYAGRLVPEKGVETILALAKALPDISFKIVGHGPEEARLHALGHGLKNVEFLGFQSGEALFDLYRGSRAVLIPSRWHENFPLTALEAMAAGKPVIGSHVGGMPEVVEDHRTGLLVSPVDLQAWVEAVLRLALDEELRARLGVQARLSVETTFHIRHHRERVLKAYETLIQQNKIRGG